MAWTASGLFVQNFIDALDPSNLALDLTLTTYKIALFNNAVTPDYSAVAASAAYNAGTWLTANEVSGTNWAAGGKTFATAASGGTSTAPTLTINPAGTMMWDMNDVNVASATFSNAYGALLYADPLTPKSAICAVYFGGSAYSPNNGTFSITWAATGVFALDLTP